MEGGCSQPELIIGSGRSGPVLLALIFKNFYFISRKLRELCGCFQIWGINSKNFKTSCEL